MKHADLGLVKMTGIALGMIGLLPLCGAAGSVDERDPKYWDDAARMVLTGKIPFQLPEASGHGETLQVRKLCVLGNEMVAQVFDDSLLRFDIAADVAYVESFPFHVIDVTCADDAHMHILAVSWPEGRLYSIANKTDDPWSGWRRGDPVQLRKGEFPLGYVAGDPDVRVLTSLRLLTMKGDKVEKATPLSERVEHAPAARIAIVRAGNDIYFGNDGGEWGGTLRRVDATSGRVSLAESGAPVVAIVSDPGHAGCVLVARALAHFVLTDGGLQRTCHDTVETLLEKQPVWSVAGTEPVMLAFSDGIGELKDDVVVNRRAFPSADAAVAGLRYSRLPGAMLVNSGISQSVSLSGAVPMLATWRGEK